MSDFLKFKNAVAVQFALMQTTGLYHTSAGKDELWDMYLASFPEGTNPIFRKRTEHDCSCCKQFIRASGDIVSIMGDEVVSIWDINIGGYYQIVADALSALVKSREITGQFYHYEKHLGTDKNFEESDNGMITWDHFHHELPPAYVQRKADIPTIVGKHRTAVETFKRALDEIDREAIVIVLDLIGQNSLYRGEDYRNTVTEFAQCQIEYKALSDDLKRNIYCWTKNVIGAVSGIRNSAIGTLLVDLSNGKELDHAVRSFETMVAPSNYKRPTALITPMMITKAEEKVNALGITESLHRRYAHIDDLKPNDVLFLNRDAKKYMGVFDELKSEVAVDTRKFDKVEEISIDDFMANVVPTASGIELMFDNKHVNNLVSLVAPLNPSAPNILKWGNNFSWSYNGEVTDSMKARVKKAGGDVEGVLRFSIQWNDEGNNNIDFDAHCIEPNRNLISYKKAGEVQLSSGVLDVDIVSPNGKIAVENITYSNIDKMQNGQYSFIVHNYDGGISKAGFTAEIEYKGVIHQFVYNKKLRGREKIIVALIDFNKATGIKFIKSLDSTSTVKNEWGINTQQFHNVSMVMNSPNYWDGEQTGNKHWFFMLTGCNNAMPARGFYNEFLNGELTEHRKVFEVLGSKMKTGESDNQLSGLGFSSTKRDSVICKVSGSFSRMLKINF